MNYLYTFGIVFKSDFDVHAKENIDKITASGLDYSVDLPDGFDSAYDFSNRYKLTINNGRLDVTRLFTFVSQICGEALLNDDFFGNYNYGGFSIRLDNGTYTLTAYTSEQGKKADVELPVKAGNNTVYFQSGDCRYTMAQPQHQLQHQPLQEMVLRCIDYTTLILQNIYTQTMQVRETGLQVLAGTMKELLGTDCNNRLQ